VQLALHPALLATGRFTVRASLGAGSFGAVFEVHDAEADAVVALKWLRAGDSATLARFKREFRSLSDLAHPNLVRYRDLFTYGGEWFFTMDLVEGSDLLRFVRTPGAALAPDRDLDPDASSGSLEGSSGISAFGSTEASPQERIASHPPPEDSGTMALPGAGHAPARAGSPPAEDEDEPPSADRPACLADPARLRSALEQLGAGLDALHAADMIHRDIKPSNVLVTTEGRVVILDLGLVTELDGRGIDMSKSGIVVGTPAYVSPEQALGQRVTRASDWYAVGVILYQALTGHLPLDGSPHELLLKKQLGPPRRPSARVRGVSPALDRLCMDLLARAPEVRPTGRDFQARLAEAFEPSLAGARARAATPSRAPTELVGRDAELATLAGALDEVARGKTVVALVHGASGMGKTALVRAFLERVRASRPDTLVLEGRCYEREAVPYKALDALVDALCRYLNRLPEVELGRLLPRDAAALARVFPVLLQVAPPSRKRGRDAVDAIEGRRRAAEALRELVSRVGDQRPLVVFVDDLHWGDADSEPFLAALLRAPDPPSMLFVAAYRSEEAAAAPLVAVVRGAAATGGEASGPLLLRDVAVEPLSPAAAAELARAFLAGGRDPTSTDELARNLAEESLGSPLFLRQLASLDASSGPVDLATAISRRVDALPPETRRMLEVLAAAGQPLPLAVAARVAGIDHDAPAHLTRLRDATLVRTRGDTAAEAELYHDRIRDVVVAALAPDAARAIHRKLGRVLSSVGDEHAEAVARHYELAQEHRLAAQYAEKAADRASTTLAFGRAASMYERALGLSSAAGSSAASLVLKLAEALVLAGRSEEAASRFLELTKAGDRSADALELRRRAAEQMLFGGQIEAGLAIIEELLSAMRMTSSTTPLGVVCSLLWRRFVLFVRGFGFRERGVDELARDELVRIDTCASLAMGLGMVEPIRGADYQTRYLLLALRSGETERIARGLALEAVYRASEGVARRRDVERLLDKATSMAERSVEPAAVARIRLLRGATSILFGDFARALELCDEAAATLRERCVGVTWELDNASLLSGVALLALGRIRELDRRLPSHLEEARARGSRYAEITLRMQCAWFCALARDDVDGARADIQRLEPWAGKPGERVLLQSIWAMTNGADIELYDGRPEEALGRHEAAWDRLRRALFFRAEGVRVLATDARARSTLAVARISEGARRRELLDRVDAAVRSLRRERWPTARGQRLLLEAGVLELEGHRARGIETLREAIAELDGQSVCLFAAAGRLRLGEMLGGAEGKALLDRARTEMTEEGIAKPEKVARLFAPFLA